MIFSETTIQAFTKRMAKYQPVEPGGTLLKRQTGGGEHFLRALNAYYCTLCLFRIIPISRFWVRTYLSRLDMYTYCVWYARFAGFPVFPPLSNVYIWCSSLVPFPLVSPSPPFSLPPHSLKVKSPSCIHNITPRNIRILDALILHCCVPSCNRYISYTIIYT